MICGEILRDCVNILFLIKLWQPALTKLKFQAQLFGTQRECTALGSCVSQTDKGYRVSLWVSQRRGSWLPPTCWVPDRLRWLSPSTWDTRFHPHRVWNNAFLEAGLKTRSMSRGDSYWPRQPRGKMHTKKSGLSICKAAVCGTCVPGSRHQGARASHPHPNPAPPLISFSATEQITV